MKYLYLQFLNLRVWLLRRRLRKMGFREVADKTSARMLMQLPKDRFEEKKLILDWLKIGLTAFAVLSMWLIFFLRQSGPVEVKPMPNDKSSLSAPADPGKSEIVSF